MSTQVIEKTLETLPPSAKEAVSTPKEIDYFTVVEQCAKRKADIGQSFQGKKGKQGLFAITCKAVKSLKGMAVTELLPAEEENLIRQAVTDFWLSKANILLSYGTVVSFTLDKPSVSFSEEMVVTEVAGNATLKAQREPKDKHEKLLWLHHLKASHEKRLNQMLENLSKYDRQMIAEQQAKCTGLEQAILQVEATEK